jgi:hypothetical protein
MFIGPVMKQNRWVRRLTGMQTPLPFDRPLRPAASTAFRTALALGVALLLILVLFPAAIAAQAATI